VATARVELRIAADPDLVWKLIGDFDPGPVLPRDLAESLAVARREGGLATMAAFATVRTVAVKDRRFRT